MLKKFIGPTPDEPLPLPIIEDGRVIPIPAKALSTCMRRGVKHILVQWAGSSEMDATWEPFDDFVQQYPTFQLEDELLVEQGRDVTWGIRYKHRSARGSD
jgi:hypothetical protein